MAGAVSKTCFIIITKLNWTYAGQYSCHVEHLDTGQWQVGCISTCGRSGCELPQRPVHGVIRSRLSSWTLQQRPCAYRHESGHGEQQLYVLRECTCNGPQPRAAAQAPHSISESKLRLPRLVAALTHPSTPALSNSKPPPPQCLPVSLKQSAVSSPSAPLC